MDFFYNTSLLVKETATKIDSLQNMLGSFKKKNIHFCSDIQGT